MIILVTSILTAYNRKNAVPHLCKHCPNVRKTEIISANRQSTNPPRILYLGSLLQLFLQFVPLLGRSSRSKANIGRLFPLRFIYSLNYNYCIYINAWMLIATQLFTASLTLP